jgi:hypothetical protein
VRFQCERKFVPERFKIGAGRHVNGLRGQASKLVVGEYVRRAGAGVAGREPSRIVDPQQADRVAVRNEFLAPAKLRAQCRHGRLAAEGDDDIGLP